MWAISASLGLAFWAGAGTDARARAKPAAVATKRISSSMVAPAQDRPAKHWMRIGGKGSRKKSGETEAAQHLLSQALAAGAGEGEDIAECGSDVALHFRAKQCAGAIESGLHGLGRNFEQVRGFRHAHALDQPGDEHFPERRRQLVDSALEKSADFGLGHGRLGVGNAIGVGKGYDLSVKGRRGRDKADVDRGLAAPDQAQRFVDHDPRKPGAKARLAAEPVESGEGADIGLLQHVL